MIRRLIFVLAQIFLFCSAVSGQSSYSDSDTGHKVLGSYFASDIDDVALKNGNLHVRIPLFTLPGRELPVTVSMEYDSQLYEYRVFYNPPSDPIEYYEFLGWRKNIGVAGILNASKSQAGSLFYTGVWNQTLNLSFTRIESNGTKHNFTKQVTRQCLDNIGGTCYQPNPSDAVIYDGYTIDSGASEFLRLLTGNHFSGGAQPAKIFFKDGRSVNITTRTLNTRNGNFLTGNASTQTVTLVPGGGPSSTSLADFLPSNDTTGRSIGWTDGTIQVITITDVNGQPKTYRITWTTLPINNSSHPCVTMVNTQFKVVSSIQLPNGKTYSFEYNTNGYLNKLILPSGAYIRYTYTTYTNVGCRYYVSTRNVSADGLPASEKTWNYGFDWQVYEDQPGGNWFRWLSSATITKPSGSAEEHGFTLPSCNWNSACAGQENRISYKQGSTTLKQIDKSWNTGTNPSVSIETTTMWIYKSEHRLYYDSYNNLTQEDHYDWGMGAVGPRLRYVLRTYSSANQTYADAWILNRVTSEKIYTNAGSLTAQTDYELDNYADPNTLVTRSGTIPGWTDPGSTTRGNVTRVKTWLNTDNSWPTTISRFDVLGNVVKVTDPGGHATDTDFTDRFTDGVTTRYTFAYPTRVTDPSGFYADTTYDFNTGLARQTTDSLNRTTTTTYDQMNRTLQITPPNGAWTLYTYDDIAPSVKKEVLVDTLNNKGTVITRFDKLYRVTQTETFDPGVGGNIFVDTQYDSNGRKWKVSNPYRTGETVQWTVLAYDAVDRPTTTTAPDSSVVQYAYNDNQTTVTDEAGNQRRYTYDGLGRMTKVEEPNPTLDTPLVTTYAYNVLGKMTQTAQGTQNRTFNFDSLGRMTSQILPESGTTSFTYNVDSLLLTKTDARGIITTVTYGTSGGGGHYHDVQSRGYSDGTPVVTFGYNTQGLRTSMSDGLGSAQYFYYSNTDKLEHESRTLTGVTGTFTTAYVYNLKGDLIQMTYPSGRVVNFNYATGGGCCNSRLSSVVDQTTSTTVNSGITFNAAGEVTAHTLGNGVAQTYSYNSRLQLNGINAAQGATTLMSFTYDYGTSTTNTGRVLSRTDSIQQEHSSKYVYDSIYRLGQTVSNDNSWGIAWTFDTWGNRLTQSAQGLATGKVTSPSSTYANNKLMISCFGQAGDCYDAAGNMKNDGGLPTPHNYTFNAENQITQMDGGAAIYAYDGEGRRMKKTVGSETTYMFYGVGGLLCEFTTTNTGATAAASTDRTTYKTSDKLGTAVLILNASGTVIENNRTLPYGEAWLPETASTNDKKFTTYLRDAESNLDYAVNRYHSPTAGRFVSVDKDAVITVLPSTLNRYAYVINDPVNHTDVSGVRMTLTIEGPILSMLSIGLGSSGVYASPEGLVSGPSIPMVSPGAGGQAGGVGGGDGFVLPLDQIGRYGAFINMQGVQLASALAEVSIALQRGGCAGLLGGGDAARSLFRSASFSYAANAIRPPSTSDEDWAAIRSLATDSTLAAGTMRGRPITFLNDNFFVRPSDVSGMATTLIHELLHQAGKGPEIDVKNPDGSYANYAEISEKCGTRDSSK